ncbi:MAG TPA: chorismate mutase [Rhodospirillaceae bacterium]|nr:chorismate mutase [Rhodospirillaceae bacterium]
MSKQLEEIRKKIDAIDDAVHDLLMERASLVAGVAAEKKKNNMQVVQPAREARMIRRLLSRHKGPLPEAAVISIWRELVGAVSLLQTGLNVAVTVMGEDYRCWDMARDYFGSVLPMKKISSPQAAIAAVRDGSVSFAVLPWPDDTDEKHWWPVMLNTEGGQMRVVCALPYGRGEDENASARGRALVVSKVDFNSSGDDRSFIALELDPSVSRGRISDVLKGIGLETLGLNTQSGAKQGVPSLHLAEVSDFVAEDDARLEEIKAKFGDLCLRAVALGGYPALPVFKSVVIQQESQSAPKTKDSKKNAHV